MAGTLDRVVTYVANPLRHKPIRHGDVLLTAKTRARAKGGDRFPAPGLAGARGRRKSISREQEVPENWPESNGLEVRVLSGERCDGREPR